MSHFHVSSIVWAKSQDSVRKPPFFIIIIIFFKRKEGRSGSNRGLSAYQPSALPLGHTGSEVRTTQAVRFKAPTHFLTQSLCQISCRGKPVELINEIGLQMVSLDPCIVFP